MAGRDSLNMQPFLLTPEPSATGAQLVTRGDLGRPARSGITRATIHPDLLQLTLSSGDLDVEFTKASLVRCLCHVVYFDNDTGLRLHRPKHCRVDFPDPYSSRDNRGCYPDIS